MQAAPVVVTASPAVLAEVERVAAAAGIAIDHVGTVGTVGSGAWRRAPLVLLDVDQVGAAVAAHLPRREHLIVLADGELTADLWASCVALGASRVLGLHTASDDLVLLLADAAESGSAGADDGRIVAVLGACGGAGATVLAAATAVAARRSGRAVVLVDADPWGPGIEVTLGMETSDGARWEEIAAPSGRLPAEVLHRALPSVTVSGGPVAVLCHSRRGEKNLDPGLLHTVLDAARRAGDVAVIDLPRVPSPASDQAISRADLTVLVVPAEVRGCYGAAAVLPRLSDLGARVGLVVRGPSPGGLGADDIALTLELPLLAGMRPEPGLARRLEGGRPPGDRSRGPLARAAAAVLTALGVAP